ncbi:hypothetical protein HDU80_002350, partial [Chytriomyces hyalinus]
CEHTPRCTRCIPVRTIPRCAIRARRRSDCGSTRVDPIRAYANAAQTAANAASRVHGNAFV